ncbi:hypothetical protein AcV5_010188 [Taiwanofungus camphoratus]|nr:hypothetical protein AcV5_010188 [Antrodia cinnamomea]
MQGTSASDDISESAAFDRWFSELTELVLSFEVPTTAGSDLSSESVAFERWFREFTETPIRENAFEYTSVTGPCGSGVGQVFDREYEAAGALLDELANLDAPLPPVPGSIMPQQATGTYEWDPSFGLAGGPTFDLRSIDWPVATTTEDQGMLYQWLAEPFPAPLVPSQAPMHHEVFAMAPDPSLMTAAPQGAAYVGPQSSVAWEVPEGALDSTFGPPAAPRPARQPRTKRTKRTRAPDVDTGPAAGPSEPARRRRRRNDGTAVAVAAPPPPSPVPAHPVAGSSTAHHNNIAAPPPSPPVPAQPVAGPSTEPLDGVKQCSWRGCATQVSRDTAWRHFQDAHMGEAHNGRIACQHAACTGKTNGSDMGVGNVRRHYEADLGFRSFKCPHCGAVFKRRDMFNRHLERHCHVCPHCSVGFGSSNARIEHANTCSRRPGSQRQPAADFVPRGADIG